MIEVELHLISTDSTAETNIVGEPLASKYDIVSPPHRHDVIVYKKKQYVCIRNIFINARIIVQVIDPNETASHPQLR